MQEKRNLRKYALLSVMIVGLLVAIYATPMLNQTQEIPEIPDQQRSSLPGWHDILDYNPGAGAGGFQRIVVKALNWTGASVVNSNASLSVNLSDISATGFTSDIPHTTKFGIYVVARFNATQAYSAGNSTWVQAWVRCRITSAGLNIAADTVMNKTLIVACGTTMMYEAFYIEINASSKPLMLYRDSSFAITSIKLEAYY
jgi:hypothetical protein